MKILLVDNGVTGHHISYLDAILKHCNYEFVIALPSYIKEIYAKQYTYVNHIESKRIFRVYIKWLREIYRIAEQERVDVIHFLEGDILYRFFGIGLNLFKRYRIIITFHRLGAGKLKKISTRIISSFVDRVVVHSEYIQRAFNLMKVDNVVHIEYPQFNAKKYDKTTAKQYFGIGNNEPVIGCIGATREEKGLDILLTSLATIDMPFQLLIAGKAVAFDENYIIEHSKSFVNSVHFYLKFMSEEELSKAFSACDIICLPYRKTFNGASGPLGEGVALGCCIIGPDHGNLGDTISRHHLGFTFEAEKTDSLAKAISQALAQSFVPDDDYLEYKKQLSPRNFGEKYLNLYALFE